MGATLHNTRQVIEYARKYIGGSVCDLGEAAGKYKDIICRSADSYLSFDLDGADVMSGDINPILPWDDATFDTVISVEIIEHLAEPGFFIDQIRRILKSGGICILTAPFLLSRHAQGSRSDYLRFTPDGLAILMQRSGFETVEAGSYNYFFGTIFLLLHNRFMSKWSGRIGRCVISNLEKTAWRLDSHSGNGNIFSNSYVIAKKI